MISVLVVRQYLAAAVGSAGIQGARLGSRSGFPRSQVLRDIGTFPLSVLSDSAVLGQSLQVIVYL
jgi:hypothetical protein